MPFDGKNGSKNYKELKSMPKIDGYSRITILVTVLSGIFLGGYIGKKVAHFLEVCDLFTPDIVDDD
ncbi:hypothetical protein KR009_001705 [Drosophila setifemur]|nr:hypothetical protein KR009_001705 [Drosophila setifemur]